MKRRCFLGAATAAIAASCATRDMTRESSPFTITNDATHLTVLEHDAPVFVYNSAPVAPPEGVDGRYRRGNYIHPLYSPDGAIVTEDFPKDHYHHRGVFWAWPNCHVNGRKLNIWELESGRSVFEDWTRKEALRRTARLEEIGTWKFDADGFAPVGERVAITVHPAKSRCRSIDFQLTFRNIADTDVIFQGSAASAGTAGTGAKGYGGFSFRPDATNKPFTFTGKDGVIAEDHTAYATHWADISWGADTKRGVAIIQHPKNPGYPHPGWLFRHYGFLGVSWPHNEAYTLNPSDSFTLRYRLVVHEGDAAAAAIARIAESYTQYA